MQWLWLQVFLDKPINKFFLKVTVIIYSRISFFIIICATNYFNIKSFLWIFVYWQYDSWIQCFLWSRLWVHFCATGAEGSVSGSSATDAASELDSATVPATGLAIGTATLEVVETTVLSATTFNTAVADPLWLALSLRRGRLVSHGQFFAATIAFADFWLRDSSCSFMNSNSNWQFPEVKLFLWLTAASTAGASSQTKQNIALSSKTSWHVLPCFQLFWNVWLVDTSPADTMLPKAAILALKGLLGWSNFISALNTGMKVHYIILFRTRTDLVFQPADYLGMRWLLLIYPLYIWLTGSKFAYDRPRKQGTTEQVAIIYAASDPKGNDANSLCPRG